MIILLDMNLSPTWLPKLAEARFEAKNSTDLGSKTAPDHELFQWARENRALIFTHDLDFGNLLALTGAESPSVFEIRTQDVTPESLAPRAIALLNRFRLELTEGAIIVADELREKIRLLPLAR